MKSTLRQSMIGLSSLINHTVAANMPDACPFILVCEFPRSGANWIRDMIGDALQLPVPRFSLLPITFSSLVHSHFVKPVRKAPVVYVVRDGRDVFVSHYYKAWNAATQGPPSQQRRTVKFHHSLAIDDPGRSLNDKLLAFYQEWKSRPIGSRVSWGTHVETWLQDSSANVHVVRYEDMLKNPETTLKEVAQGLAGDEIDDSVISFAVKRNSFEFKTGRKPGEADNSANRRSGRAGGWREALPLELQEEFLTDFSGALRLAGYLD